MLYAYWSIVSLLFFKSLLLICYIWISSLLHCYFYYFSKIRSPLWTGNCVPISHPPSTMTTGESNFFVKSDPLSDTPVSLRREWVPHVVIKEWEMKEKSWRRMWVKRQWVRGDSLKAWFVSVAVGKTVGARNKMRGTIHSVWSHQWPVGGMKYMQQCTLESGILFFLLMLISSCR